MGSEDERFITNSPIKETAFSRKDKMEKKNRSHECKKTLKEKTTFCCKSLKKENWLVIFTVTGVLFGILLGFSVKTADPSEDVITLVSFPGEIFMRLLRMLIVPIVFTSIVTGLASMDLKKGGRMGLHALAYYLTTTVLATITGIILVTTIRPGSYGGSEHNVTVSHEGHSTLDTVLDVARNIFPDNIITACFESTRTEIVKERIHLEGNNATNSANTTAIKIIKTVHTVRNTNVLGLIAFCIAFGITMSSLGEDGRLVAKVFKIFNDIFMRMMNVVIWFSPVGICSLIANKILEMSNFEDVGRSLGMFMVTVITGLIIHAFLTLPLIYWIFTRGNAYRIARGVIQAMLTAFGTCSSIATLPVTLQCLENNLGIDKKVTRFMVPIGATINMDGGALHEAVATITVAQMYNIPLTFGQIIVVSLTATLASISAASVPSAGMIALLLVMEAVGLPTEAVAIFWSIEWFVDRLRTPVNVYGDCIGAGIVCHLNKKYLESTIVASSDQEIYSEDRTLDEEQKINETELEEIDPHQRGTEGH